MNRKEAFIALNMVPALGYKRVTDMLKVFGEPQRIFKASEEKLKRFYGIGDEISKGISEFPMGTIPDRVNFPKRNRIISGFSLIRLLDC